MLQLDRKFRGSFTLSLYTVGPHAATAFRTVGRGWLGALLNCSRWRASPCSQNRTTWWHLLLPLECPLPAGSVQAGGGKGNRMEQSARRSWSPFDVPSPRRCWRAFTGIEWNSPKVADRRVQVSTLPIWSSVSSHSLFWTSTAFGLFRKGTAPGIRSWSYKYMLVGFWAQTELDPFRRCAQIFVWQFFRHTVLCNHGQPNVCRAVATDASFKNSCPFGAGTWSIGSSWSWCSDFTMAALWWLRWTDHGSRPATSPAPWPHRKPYRLWRSGQ